MTFRRSYRLDQILIEPRRESRIKSREDVDTSVEFFGIPLSFPIFAAPMDSLGTKEFIMAMSALGGLAFVHRYDPHKIVNAAYLMEQGATFGVAVGLREPFEVYLDADIPLLLIDVANGHNETTIARTEQISAYAENMNSKTRIMVGNVASVEGWDRLAEAGADFIRVGIGNGSACTTRLKAGVGVPQATLIDEIAQNGATWADRQQWPVLVADGGIQNSGDIVKCLALGAQAVMVGYLFSGVMEARPHYHGMASREAKIHNDLEVGYIEGIDKQPLHNGIPLKYVVKDIVEGLQSGMSYLDAKNVYEIMELQSFFKFHVIED